MRFGRAAAAVLFLAGPLLSACHSEPDPVKLFTSGHYRASFKDFRQLADSGNAGAANFIGIQYYLGAGVDRDFKEAARWFRSAALARDPYAQKNLGVMYLRGLGVPRNDVHAYGWLFEAVANGNARARGYLRVAGDHITPNQTMLARRWIARQLRRDGSSRRP